MAPSSVMRPIRSLPMAVNQSAPSGPATMPNGLLPGGNANDVASPGGRDATDPIVARAREPQCPVARRGDQRRARAGSVERVHVDRAVDADARDLAAVHERHPERVVRPRRQRVWARARGSDWDLHRAATLAGAAAALVGARAADRRAGRAEVGRVAAAVGIPHAHLAGVARERHRVEGGQRVSLRAAGACVTATRARSRGRA